MPSIKHLDSDVINKIAAGEVVQRPASVLKELVENSIDAGSTKIDINILDSGKTLIEVSDNGKGMSKDDLELCYLKHTTSKISNQEDLFKLTTKGFRGEAISSICSVSKFKISSSDFDNLRNVLSIENGKIINSYEESGLKGTTISVSNLFYNVPARRKFLKSDNVELRHLVNEFIRISIPHYDVSFSFKHNGNLLYLLNPSNLKERIVRIFGNNINNKLVEISESTEIGKISGFIFKSEFLNKSRKNQFLFVNNRYIKSSYLNHSISKAYEGLIKPEYNPGYFIFFEIPEDSIDINVHPTKTEVKFENESSLYAILNSSVRHSLGKFNVIPNIDFSNDINLSNLSSESNIKPPNISFSSDFNPFTDIEVNIDDENEKNDDRLFNSNLNNISENSNFNNAHDYFSISDKYIVTKTKSNLILINIKRARYRVLYERFLTEISSEHNNSQKLMFPIVLNFDREELAILNEIKIQLSHIGFDFLTFGEEKIEINGINPLFETEKINLLFNEFIENKILEVPSSSSSINDHLAILMAKSKSSKSKSILNYSEQEELVNQLFACKKPELCPNGKITFHTLTNDVIEKFFK